MQLDKYLKFKKNRKYKWVLLICFNLYISIWFWKIEGKDIIDMFKLISEFIYYFFI